MITSALLVSANGSQPQATLRRRKCKSSELPLTGFPRGNTFETTTADPSGKQEELPSRRSNAALAQYAPRIPAFNKPIPNILGKNIVAVVVDYPPGASNPPYNHTGSAFVGVCAARRGAKSGR